MRRLALAAAFIAAPALASAQSAAGSTLSTYTVYGCASGPVYASATENARGYVFGTPFCVHGVASLDFFSSVPDGGQPYRVTTTLAAVFNADFTGAGAGYDEHGTIGLSYRGPSCTVGCMEFASTPLVGWSVGGQAQTFSTGFLVSAATADPSTVRLTDGGAALSYTIPGGPDSSPVNGMLTFHFTATPEPATLALTLGGLAVLGAGARRRRHA